MIALPPATRVWLACGPTDMRKGMCGLAVMAQEVMKHNPHSGAVFAFRGRRGDLVKLLWYDGQGLCLFSKRIDRQVRVADEPGRCRAPVRRAAGDAARRGRLAASSEDVATRPCGLIIGGIEPFLLVSATLIR